MGIPLATTVWHLQFCSNVNVKNSKLAFAGDIVTLSLPIGFACWEDWSGYWGCRFLPVGQFLRLHKNAWKSSAISFFFSRLFLLLPLPVWNVKRPMRKAIQKCNNNNDNISSSWQEEDATSWTLHFLNFNQVSCCCLFVFNSIEGRRAAARATVLEALKSVLSLEPTASLFRLFLYKYYSNNSCNYSQHDLRTIGIGL